MKTKVLETLKKHKEQFISGEELSNQIGVSRTAVWKHINQLKEEGYEIESASRKGYRLMTEPDVLEAHALQSELSTQRIGKKIVHFDSIGSTNTEIKKLAQEGVEEGTVVIAEEQTGGRGRLGRTWASPKGTGIWMSILLRPSINPSEAAKITQIAAAAVAVAIRETTGCEAGVKWPNDIILQKKKVCGILTEMSSELDSVNYIVVGIGINANVDVEDFPEDIRKIATSIKGCKGEAIHRKDLVLRIIEKFEELYFHFLQEKSIIKSVEICKEYSVTLGNRVRIIHRDQERQAEAVDITKEGELVIRNEQNQLEKVISGEVSVRGITDYV